MKKFSSQILASKTIWLVLVPIAFLCIGWFLYMPFRKGGEGVYWLLIIFQSTVLPLTGIFLLSWILSLFMWAFHSDKENGRMWSKRSNKSFAMALLFLASSIPLIIGGPIHHLDGISTQNSVYYLSEVYPPGNINFQLYECDTFGLVCTGVYRSYDFGVSHKGQAQLEFDKNKKFINVISVQSQEIIYKYFFK